MSLPRRSFSPAAPPRVVVVSQQIDPGGMAASVVRGFEELGVPARLANYGQLAHRLRDLGGRAGGLLHDVGSEALRPLLDAQLVREVAAFDPDVVLFIKADAVSLTAYRALRLATRARLVAFHPDDPFNVGRRRLLRRRGGPAHRRALGQMRAVDVVLTWSHAFIARARAVGAREVHFAPFACDPALHPRLPADAAPPELRADVVFIGSWDPERERWMAALAELEGLDFALWGGAWDHHCKNPKILAAWRKRPLYGVEMAQAVAGGAIHVNILRAQNKDAHNMRTFEIPCAGGFMLHERSAEAAALLPPGEACDDFATPEELAAKVRQYLADPAARQRIAEAGHARVLAEHTYTHWARRVLVTALGEAATASWR